MQSCPCSIFDVREEQILETSGSLRVRLICNVCGSLIDSKVVHSGDDGSQQRSVFPNTEPLQPGGVGPS